MKYNIEGFDQETLVEMGLNANDAIILRWFVDFYSTDKMAVVHDESGVAFKWVKYQSVIEDLPILGIKNKQVIARHFDKMSDAGIIKKYIRKIGGTFSCFRLTEKYRGLIEKYTPIDSIVDTPIDSIVDTKDYSIKLNNSIKYTKNKKFIKPTIEEIKDYCHERNNAVDPTNFFNHYEAKGWMIGKSPMKDWKAAVRTWERNNYSTDKTSKKTGEQIMAEYEEEKRRRYGNESK